MLDDSPDELPNEVHAYVSTACRHGQCGKCRGRCKFCPSVCSCRDCDHSHIANFAELRREAIEHTKAVRERRRTRLLSGAPHLQVIVSSA